MSIVFRQELVPMRRYLVPLGGGRQALLDLPLDFKASDINYLKRGLEFAAEVEHAVMPQDANGRATVPFELPQAPAPRPQKRRMKPARPRGTVSLKP